MDPHYGPSRERFEFSGTALFIDAPTSPLKRLARLLFRHLPIILFSKVGRALG